jgi:segregation and condensation protein B
VGDPCRPAVSAERLIEVLGLATEAELEQLAAQLQRRYESEGRPYRVVKLPQGYALQLEEAFVPFVRRLHRRSRPQRLSQAAMEVLAIVAYRQPITAEEVNQLRGRPSHHLLSQLVQKGLLQAAPEPGKNRPLVFRTTRAFEELFGLEGLEDLPRVVPDPNSGQQPTAESPP